MTGTVKRGIAAGLGCVVVAVGCALAVDGRLDRQWGIRLAMLCLTLICGAILASPRRRGARGRGARVLGVVGVVLWGVVAPLLTTASATPPHVDFALAVVDDATAAANRAASSVVTVQDIRAAVQARGGAVGTLPSVSGTAVTGADRFPLVLRPDPARQRPRVCVTIEHGFDAKIRSC